MVSPPSRRAAPARPADDDAQGPADAESTALPLADVAELPWLVDTLKHTLARQQGHAILVHGDAGIGALEFAYGLARGWLCEAAQPPDGPSAQPACGLCAGCRLARAQTHPDLLWRLPEALALRHGFAIEVDDRRKPSRQIRVADLRAALDWTVTTSGRGRGKVLVVHPAEAMNAVTASALLKTLEEPPAGVRIVLTTADPGLLMPTILSRCQRVALPRPSREGAAAWLRRHQVPEPEVLLDGAAGSPLTALRWHAEGLDARAWAALPAAVSRGDASALAGWPVPRLVDALQKLAHDAALRSCGALPRFFPPDSVPPAADRAALHRWHQSLQRVMRHAEHPWNDGLLAEALVAEGAEAWGTASRGGAGSGGRASGRAALAKLTAPAP
jgi:DNA polymerase-3 subunit delta'